MALSEVASRHGYAETTISRVVEVAGISRRTFYELFGERANAYRAAHEEALDLLGLHVESACRSAAGWPGQVTAGAAAALEWSAREPQRAYLLASEPLVAGPCLGYGYDRLVARFAPALRVGRNENGARPPAIAEEALVLGFAQVVASRLHTGRRDSLPGLAVPLTEFLLAPYRDAGA